MITDAQHQRRFSHAELARFAAEGGADVVQLRDKRARTTRELIAEGRAMQVALAGSGARLLVDDRVDVALALGVEAVHLGADDLEPALARRLLGPRALIGATAHDLTRAIALGGERLDGRPVSSYLGVGPVFGTRSKARPAPALGLGALRAIVEAVDAPVVAIGAIDAGNVRSVLEQGAHGVAVLSGVVCADDPLGATRRLRAAIDDWLSESTTREVRDART